MTEPKNPSSGDGDLSRDPLFRHEVDSAPEATLYLRLVQGDDRVHVSLNCGAMTQTTSLAFAAMLNNLARALMDEHSPFVSYSRSSEASAEDGPLSELIRSCIDEPDSSLRVSVEKAEYNRHLSTDDTHAWRSYLRSMGFNPDATIVTFPDERNASRLYLMQERDPD